VGALNLITFQ